MRTTVSAVSSQKGRNLAKGHRRPWGRRSTCLLAALLLLSSCGTGGGTESGTRATLAHTAATDETIEGPIAPDSDRSAGSGDERSEDDGPADGPGDLEAANEPQAASDPAEDGGPVTIAFGGDIHFESYLGTGLVDQPLELLDPVADLMAGADIALANLETTITERGTPTAKAFNFRAPPVAFDALRSAGIDVVSMANNHGLDYGVEGLEDSLAFADDAGFPVIGIGLNADEAYAPWSAEVNGQRIAIIAATQVLDSSLIDAWTATDDQPGLASAKEVERLVEAVEAARETNDTVVVFLHWGIEGQTCPAERQIELADRLVAAGADVVVGGHAHRVQGGGRKGDALVHYGLGNLVFYTDAGPGTDSGVLLVTVDGRTIESYEWVPARLRSGVATRLEGDEAAGAAEGWERLRDCTDLEP